jgi:hypothetical protein
MKKTTIKAVEMVRTIRDAHYEQLRGKSPEELIAFYRAKARLLQVELAAQHQKQSADELQPA